MPFIDLRRERVKVFEAMRAEELVYLQVPLGKSIDRKHVVS